MTGASCDLSIVIVNWNTRDLLRDCLASLPAACSGLTTETVVVDNRSADGSAAMVREQFPGVNLIDGGGNIGFSRGNNLAFASCGGRFVLLLNPDTVAPPGSLTTLLRFLESEPGAGAAGPILTDAEGRPTLSYGCEPRLRHHLLSVIDPARRWLPRRWREQTMARVGDPAAGSRDVEYIVGACLMIRRETLARIGPLDERFFMYFEENDWCLRARRAGWRVLLCADARVAHLEGRAAEKAGDFTRAQFQKSYRLFVAKHGGPAKVLLHRAAQFLEYGLKAVLRRCAGVIDPRGRDRHRALARHFGAVAALQLRREISVLPPR